MRHLEFCLVLALANTGCYRSSTPTAQDSDRQSPDAGGDSISDSVDSHSDVDIDTDADLDGDTDDDTDTLTNTDTNTASDTDSDSETTTDIAFQFQLLDLDPPSRSANIWGDGSYLYAVDTFFLKALQFDGNAFKEMSKFFTPNHALDVWGDGNFIYVADGSSGLRAYSFDGVALEERGFVDTTQWAHRDQRQLEMPVDDNYFCRLRSY